MEMVAVDTLEVSRIIALLLLTNHCGAEYIEAIPLYEQTAVLIHDACCE